MGLGRKIDFALLGGYGVENSRQQGSEVFEGSAGEIPTGRIPSDQDSPWYFSYMTLTWISAGYL